MSKDTNNLIIKNLIDFGLSEKEALVYLSLLELEIAPVQEIAKTAGINRSSTYVVLESLKKKGLVGVSDDKSVQQYVATTPEALVRIAKDSTEKQKNILNNIENILPELKALHKETKKKPKVRVFEGDDGLKQAFDDSLSCKEKLIRICSSHEDLFKVSPHLLEYFKGYVGSRIKKGIKMHGIHPDSELARHLVKQGPKNFDTPVLIPKDKFTFPVDFAIYDNTVGFMSREKSGFAIVIENRDIAKVMKNVFDLAWAEAKRIAKK